MSEQCDAIRWDVDPTCNPFSSWYRPHVCDHDVCRQDRDAHAFGATHDSLWECPSGRCELARNEAQCELDTGHHGAHAWPEPAAPVLGASIRRPELEPAS